MGGETGCGLGSPGARCRGRLRCQLGRSRAAPSPLSSSPPRLQRLPRGLGTGTPARPAAGWSGRRGTLWHTGSARARRAQRSRGCPGRPPRPPETQPPRSWRAGPGHAGTREQQSPAQAGWLAGWHPGPVPRPPLVPPRLRGELRPGAETAAGATHLPQPLAGRAGPPTVQSGHGPHGLRGGGAALRVARRGAAWLFKRDLPPGSRSSPPPLSPSQDLQPVWRRPPRLLPGSLGIPAG